jgi:glycosyltransferase involved in cell wall biosynthesis
LIEIIRHCPKSFKIAQRSVYQCLTAISNNIKPSNNIKRLLTFARQMKVLVLSKKFPYPLKEGEPIAITYLSRSLQEQGCELWLLAMNTSKHYFDVSQLPASYNYFSHIHTTNVDNRIRPLPALKSLLSGDSYILSRFNSPEFAEKLKLLLCENDFDVVQLETVYMAHYLPVIRQHSKAKIVMRAHNVEHEIWEGVARNTRSVFKKWYLRNQNRRLAAFEIGQLQRYDGLLAITERDRSVFQKSGFVKPALVAPVGITPDDYQPDYQCFEQIQTIGFIGALDWMPNQEGVVWFIENVWKKLRQRYPCLHFHVAGKNTPDWLRQKATQGVIFEGEVESAIRFMNAHPILVAPLFSGSGIRVKILEGMALGRVLISTSIGIEGIPATSGKQGFIANDENGFLESIAYCIENQLIAKQIGETARRFIASHFDNRRIGQQVLEYYRQLTKSK